MFFVTLPSNSSQDFYPDNQVSHYSTKLLKNINLSNGDWEVGLVEILVPVTWYNVREDSCWLYVSEYIPEKQNHVYHRAVLEAGLYHDIKIAVDCLNAQLERVISEFTETTVSTPIRFSYNEASMRVSFEVNEERLMSRLSPKLCSFFDIEDKEYRGPVKVLSRGPVSHTFGQCSVYVYTDLIEPRHVGDTLAPLLRVVPFDGKRGSVQHKFFDRPHYFPLIRHSFDTIEILLTDNFGEKIPFECGHSLTTLHFRKRRVE